MQKTKLNFSTFLNILKCVLIGIVATLLGIVIFSVVLKFADLSNLIISYVNDIIKTFALFIMVMCIKRKNGERLMLKSLLAGVIYAFLTFVIFSVLNGQFIFNMTFIYDLLFAVIVAFVATIVVNILNNKKV